MKKVISIFLAAVILTFCFCSCAKKEETNQNLKLSYDSIFSYYDDKIIDAYNSLCNAVINREENVKFDLNLINDVNKIYYTSFPLSVLVSNIQINNEKGTVELQYVNDEETHKKVVKDFSDKVNKIKEECGFNKVSENEYVLNLYTYIASKNKVKLNNSNVYDVIMNNEGSSSSFAMALEYLLLQSDMNASHIYALNNKGVSFMTVVYIDDKSLVLDPFSELESNGGYGLSYFGLCEKDLTNLGFKNGFKYSDDKVAMFEGCFDDFENLRNTISYEYKDGKITANKSDNSTIELNY